MNVLVKKNERFSERITINKCEEFESRSFDPVSFELKQNSRIKVSSRIPVTHYRGVF